MTYQAVTSYQLGEPRLAAALAALGYPVRADIMKHIPVGSQEHNKLHQTWHVGHHGGEETARELVYKLQTGELYTEQPAHPFFACLAGIDTYQRLIDPSPLPLSLVPYHPKVWTAQKICALRFKTQNDGDLNEIGHIGPIGLTAPRQPIPIVPMDAHYAAAAAVCGFPLHGTRANEQGRYNVLHGTSRSMPLKIEELCLAFTSAYQQTAAATPTALNPTAIVELTHTLPGALPGEHPALYALAATQIYQAYTGTRAKKPGTFLFTANFSAVVPVNIDQKEMDLTDRFLVEGGKVFL